TCAPYVFSGCCGFLFQAEDGIRDFRVTGVQTCALPIYRLMFPIHDSRGRCIGFGGRVLKDDTPKYLNSPETVLFHKGRELYGLFEARQALRDIPRLVVVEGYMDVVGLARHGIDFAAATLGTATTTEHLNRLFRLADEVLFCFDGDRAGRDAAWRALEVALPE